MIEILTIFFMYEMTVICVLGCLPWYSNYDFILISTRGDALLTESFHTGYKRDLHQYFLKLSTIISYISSILLWTIIAHVFISSIQVWADPHFIWGLIRVLILFTLAVNMFNFITRPLCADPFHTSSNRCLILSLFVCVR